MKLMEYPKNMKKAIVTGASSGIGKAAAKLMTENGYYVFGFGRTFTDCPKENFEPIVCDFLYTDRLIAAIKRIKGEHSINAVVNCAGVAYYGLHEELDPKKIHEMTAVNIEAPLIITQMLLRDLKSNNGHIVNISSVSAKTASPKGAAYAATKAALSSFSDSLFAEARKYGVKVSSVCPDMTATALYRNADFEAAYEREYHIEPEEVAAAILSALHSEVNISEIVLRPQINKIIKKI